MLSKLQILYIIKVSSWDDKGARRLFQKLPLYNTFIEKPKIMSLKEQIYLINLLFVMN